MSRTARCVTPINVNVRPMSQDTLAAVAESFARMSGMDREGPIRFCGYDPAPVIDGKVHSVPAGMKVAVYETDYPDDAA